LYPEAKFPYFRRQNEEVDDLEMPIQFIGAKSLIDLLQYGETLYEDKFPRI